MTTFSSISEIRRFSASHVIRLIATLTVLTSASLAVVNAGEVAFDQDRLTQIDARMREFIARHQISGAVTAVATKSRIVHLSAVGQADIRSGRDMQPNSIFRIASMTKPITATAMMILHDEGKLSIDDPIEKFIPAFKGQMLKDGTAVRAVTIRDALTHTAGLSRPPGEEFLTKSLEEIVDGIGRAPLAFEPGSQWRYSSGLNVAARIIEVLSGESYADFLHSRLFKPLGMTDTTFVLSEAQVARLATTYSPKEAGDGVVPSSNAFVVLDPKIRRTPNPSGGLFSTAADIARFYQMILSGGEVDGRSIVSAKSINLMTSVQSGDVVTGFTPGNGWGLGWCIVRHPQGVSRLLNPGTCGHGGAFGTQVWMDPQRGVVFVLMIQRTNFGNADGSDLRDAFQEAAITSIRGAESDSAKVVCYFGYDRAIELTNAATKVVLCPQAGGRVLEYSLSGANALYFDEQEKDWKPGEPGPSSAGRFDIGPELVIPRRSTLWSGEWTGEITGPRSARLTSQHDEGTGVQLVRDFELDAKTSRLSCTQTIMNVSSEVKEWCHWSRTFALGEGICLIPLAGQSRFPNKYVMYEDGALINARPVDPNIRERDGFLEILAAPRRPKLGFDSYAGWMGYAMKNDLLFIKKFKTFPDRVYNEAAGLTISVWYPEGPRVELEPIGPRERLEPGQIGSFTEEWWLVPSAFPTSGTNLDLGRISAIVESLEK
ncbi:MAG: serine hydrolase [Planctomycetota bacterium]|nr:serine hydrolase [Planctomycetota bacterium]